MRNYGKIQFYALTQASTYDVQYNTLASARNSAIAAMEAVPTSSVGAI